MSIKAGTYRLGPDDGTLSVKTGRTGAAAKAGHNLLIQVTVWEATLEVGDDPAHTSIELSADATSLRVREGKGGMQALTDDDKAHIQHTIDEEILKRQVITFTSTRVRTVAGGKRLDVRGELTLLGTTRPLAVDVAVADGTLSAVAVVKQTDWGMKPHSALFGALKVADDVVVWIKAALPAGSQSL